MKKPYLILTILIFFINGCSIKNGIYTTHISEAEINNFEKIIIYALPRTKLMVSVETTQYFYKKGPFAEYASKFLGIENIILKDEEKWTISDIQILPVQEPDPSQYYMIEGLIKEQVNLEGLIKTGLILPVYRKSLVENALFYCSNAEEEKWPVVDLGFEEVPILERQIKAKTEENKAEAAADFIYRLRKRRFKLLASIEEQKAPAGVALEKNIVELNKLEEQYLSLFKGKQSIKKQIDYFEFLPDENNIKKPNVLFRFSSYQGMLPVSNLTGEPVYIQLLPSEKINPLKQFLFSKKVEVKNASISPFYRIPEEVEIRIFDNTKRLYEQKLLVSQYGVISNVPTILSEE